MWPTKPSTASSGPPEVTRGGLVAEISDTECCHWTLHWPLPLVVSFSWYRVWSKLSTRIQHKIIGWWPPPSWFLKKCLLLGTVGVLTLPEWIAGGQCPLSLASHNPQLPHWHCWLLASQLITEAISEDVHGNVIHRPNVRWRQLGGFKDRSKMKENELSWHSNNNLFKDYM